MFDNFNFEFYKSCKNQNEFYQEDLVRIKVKRCHQNFTYVDLEKEIIIQRDTINQAFPLLSNCCQNLAQEITDSINWVWNNLENSIDTFYGFEFVEQFLDDDLNTKDQTYIGSDISTAYESIDLCTTDFQYTVNAFSDPNFVPPYSVGRNVGIKSVNYKISIDNFQDPCNNFTVVNQNQNDTIYQISNGIIVNTNGQSNAQSRQTKSNESHKQLQVYPNPASNILNVRYQSYLDEAIDIHLLNSQGKVVRSQHLDAQRGLNEYFLDVSDLFSGLYVISLESSGELLSDKVIIIK